MSKVRTHYDNLKVTRDAPVTVIRAAYKALCQTFHPDKFQGNPEEAERVIKLVNTAYSVLIDPVKREEHNAWIREQEAKCRGAAVESVSSTEPPSYKTEEPQSEPENPQPEAPEIDSETAFQRAFELSDQGKHEQAFALYLQAAELGHAKAQFHLAVMFDQGKFVAQNHALAAEWYLKSAEQGNANAQYNLAHKYKTGQGVAKDENKAAYWYRQAAEVR